MSLEPFWIERYAEQFQLQILSFFRFTLLSPDGNYGAAGQNRVTGGVYKPNLKNYI